MSKTNPLKFPDKL